MAFLDEIAALLVAEGIGTVGTSIFLSSKAIIPTGAGPYLQLNETGGSGSSKTHNDSVTERPTASLIVRGSDYKVAREMLQQAYNALGGPRGLYNVELEGTYYQSINARQGPTDTGLDGDPNRVTITFNIEAEKVPS